MNFLQLAQQVRAKTGISGTGPATVAAQTGEMGRVVDWTNEAWEDIQNKHLDWNWMRLEFSFNTNAGVGEYPPAGVGINDLARWHADTLRVRPAAAALNQEQFLAEFDYDDFRNSYLFGSMRDVRSQPSVAAVRPRDKALMLGPAPELQYVVTGEYQQAPQRMVAAVDLPAGGAFPAQFHMLIVWLAVQKYATFEGAGALYQMAEREAKRIYATLERDQLPAIGLGAPLA